MYKVLENNKDESNLGQGMSQARDIVSPGTNNLVKQDC